MNIQRLGEYVEESATHQMLLGDYVGAYSLGIGEGGLYLQIEGYPDMTFPTEVEVDGEKVKLFVSYGFSAPSAYSW
jgi:hypothetical protein